MIMLLNWLLSIITFGTFSLATITMTNVDEYTYETVTNSGITLIDLFGETSAFDGTGYNLIQNATFDTDYTGWNVVGGSISVVNGALRTSYNGASSTIYPQYTGLNIPLNNILYLSTEYVTDNVPSYVSERIHNTHSSILNIGSNSRTFVNTVDPSTYLSYVSYGTGTGDYFDIDNIMLFDLTDIYGSGNEPSASEIDTWYGLYQTALTTNQHDYTYTLNTIDLEDIVVLVSSAFMWYAVIKLFREVI